jgi:two-component system chemotaxis response regulator CheY
MSLNVLVTDDSAVMRAMIVKTLRMSGLDIGEVWHAGNGVEALAVLESQWVDLALVDINMPVLNGLELLAEIGNRPSTAGLRTIVISTEGSDPRIAQVRASGAEFVHKPFTPEDLRDAVKRITGAAA